MSSNTILQTFGQIVRSVVGHSEKLIALHEPSLDQSDILEVQKVIQSGWVSYQGEAVSAFEAALTTYLGMPNAILTVNGTTALFLVLKCLNIGSQDEVLVPATTFAATANAVCHAGAIPHFVDSCSETLGVDLEKLVEYLVQISSFDTKGQLINKRSGNHIKAIIPVHVLGSAFNIQKLQNIATRFNLQIIEDSAEAVGSNYGQHKVSAMTGIGILSFNGNKIITTGGGGAIILRDDEMANKIRHLSTTAKKPHSFEFDHTEVGYNFRLPALNAALGYSQLAKIDDFLTNKRRLYNRYLEAFANLGIGQIYNPDKYGLSNCWLNAFILDQSNTNLKNELLAYLNANGIAARPLWKPLHLLDMYKQFPRSACDTAVKLYDSLICLPSSAGIVNYA